MILTAVLLMAVGASAQHSHRWTAHTISYDPGMDICPGGRSTVLLLDLPADRAVQDRINTMLVSEMRSIMGMENATWMDVRAVRAGAGFTGDSALFNWDVTCTLLYDSNEVSCLEAVSMSNCGSSVSDMPEHAYYTVDLRTGATLGRDEVMDPKQERELGRFVRRYSEAHRLDNVEYVGEHDQAKLTYRDSLGTDFHITRDHIGFSLWVYDANELDWTRRGRDREDVGDELMRVEVPKRELRTFVSKRYRKRIL
jgi:hypothetical protein